MCKAARWIILGAAGLLLQGLPAGASAKRFHEWDGSRTVPTHRILLRDEDGEKIVPQVRQSLPMSTRATCGACHDYERISHGWHFNYLDPNAPAGRPGEPWMLVDAGTGTQVPLSYRGWPRTWQPAALGLTTWDFVRMFGRHLPGGGAGAAPDEATDTAARWDVSGKLEINCLACHNASTLHDNSEWAKQIARENFRWAATAAAGFGEVGGMASRLRATWNVYQGPNLDDSEYAVAPYVRYDLQAFDRKCRAFVDVPAHPLDRQCQYCHSATVVGQPRQEADPDVHTRAGMACTACHRNGIDHGIARGAACPAGEASKGATTAQAESVTCQGCHIGRAKPDSLLVRGGRLGAPVPAHKGLPPIHLEKLACTTCHAGTWPAPQPVAARTSRANRLGIFGVATWATDEPDIVEPVFLKDADGKVAPHRMTWPAFWARIEGDKVSPLKPEDVQPAAKGILDAQLQVARLLRALPVDTNEVAVLAANGLVLRANADGGLELFETCTAGAVTGVTWAVVRNTTTLAPLMPAFDAAAENRDTALDERLAGLLRGLASVADRAAQVRPVFVYGGKVFGLDGSGTLLAGSVTNEVAQAGQAALASRDGTWGWLKDGRVTSLAPELALRSALETVGQGFAFTEEQAALTLKALASGDTKSRFGYVSSGKLFTLDAAGALTAAEHPAAQPCAWPIAHAVRPAAQSLGARKCTDCHSAQAPFFFATVTAVGPLKTARAHTQRMYTFEGQDGNFQRLFGLTFLVRSCFKAVMFTAAGIVAALLLLYGLPALHRLTKYLAARD